MSKTFPHPLQQKTIENGIETFQNDYQNDSCDITKLLTPPSPLSQVVTNLVTPSHPLGCDDIYGRPPWTEMSMADYTIAKSC